MTILYFRQYILNWHQYRFLHFWFQKFVVPVIDFSFQCYSQIRVFSHSSLLPTSQSPDLSFVHLLDQVGQFQQTIWHFKLMCYFHSNFDQIYHRYHELEYWYTSYFGKFDTLYQVQASNSPIENQWHLSHHGAISHSSFIESLLPTFIQ